MGLNDRMFDDPLEDDSENTAVDPVVTPNEADKGTDSVFLHGNSPTPSKDAVELSPEAIQELASGSVQIKAFDDSQAKLGELKSEKNRITLDNSVSRVQVKAVTEGLHIELPEHIPLVTFTTNASRTNVNHYSRFLDKTIAAESQTSVAIAHQLFAEPVEKSIAVCEHILSQHIGTLQTVIAAMSASAQEYSVYVKETKNIIFVRAAPNEEDGPFINVIQRSLSEFSFTDIQYDFNKKQLSEHAALLEDVFKMRSMRVLLNLFLAKEPLNGVFSYKKMSDTVVTISPSLQQLMDFCASSELMELPQAMSEVCNKNLASLLKLREEYTKLRANDDGLMDFIRNNGVHISDGFRTAIHLASVCFAIGQLAYHTNEIYRRLKIK